MIIMAIVLLFLIVIASIFAPLLTVYDPIEGDSSQRFLPPNKEHLLGTDHFGRDIFARILYGARITLPVSFTALFLTAVVGVVLGIISAMNFNKPVDVVIMTLVDVLLAVPFLVVAMAVCAIFGRGLENVLIVVVAVWWAPFARYTRSLVLSLKNSQMVLSAMVLGASYPVIVFREILPNIFTSLFIYLTFEFGNLILTLSTLSFFGMGIKPPLPEWGNMISDGRSYMTQSYHMLLWPIVAIIITVLALNLLGEGLRDFSNPYDTLATEMEDVK